MLASDSPSLVANRSDLPEVQRQKASALWYFAYRLFNVVESVAIGQGIPGSLDKIPDNLAGKRDRGIWD